MQRRLSSEREHLVYGGEVDLSAGVVHPSVLVRDISRHQDFFEFFSPVFNVLTYTSDEQLEEFFARPAYRDRAMYASLFGSAVPPSLLKSTAILRERTILEVEQGNLPYGGFGPGASFVSYGSSSSVQPVLVSEAVATWLRATQQTPAPAA